MKCRHSTFVSIFMLFYFSAAYAQTHEIQVTGEYAQKENDTPEIAKQLAILDSKRRALADAAAYLRSVDTVKKIPLTGDQLETYLLGIVEPLEQSSRTIPGGTGTVYQADALLRIDMAKIARLLDGLRIDAEASIDLAELWKQARPIWNPPTAQNRRSLEVDLLLAQATVALSRQEEGPSAARVTSEEGRKRARQLVEQAIALDSNNTAAHYKLGDILLVEGKPADAEIEFRKMLARDPNSSIGHDKLGNALLKESKPADAAAEFRDSIRINAGYAVAHSDLGLTQRSLRNTDGALTEFREAIRIDPDYVDAHNNLAITLASQRKIPAAIVEFREIIRISPDSALGHYNAAIALADMEEDLDCIKELRETLRINPNHYNAHYNLGEMLRLQGELKESAHEFKEYVRLVPDTPSTQNGIERAKGFIEAFEDQ